MDQHLDRLMDRLMDELARLQQEFFAQLLGQPSKAADYIESTSMCSASDRLGIYANGYKLRLKEAMAADYRKLQAYLGDEQFDELMERYIAIYPSQTTSLRFFSKHLCQLLTDEAPYKKIPILAEIEQIERAFADSFDTRDEAFARIQDLTVLAPERWPGLKISFQPSLQVLDLQHNSFAIWQAIDADSVPPEIQILEQPACWLIWRREDLVSHYRSINPVERQVLLLARAGQDFAAICEKLSEHFSEAETPAKALGFIQSWLQHEMLACFGGH